ncbi:hypothetical protein K439DRAFT_1520929 [Ramaria rubella]|nr:hypothetical protein K439DRAFT_1520929 [Ramaria rubella]
MVFFWTIGCILPTFPPSFPCLMQALNQLDLFSMGLTLWLISYAQLLQIYTVIS